jgi:SpoVK/Ycf46/Vps4 family AAA+-type ATPase
MADLALAFVQLANLALRERRQEALALIRRTLHSLQKGRPDLAPAILELLPLMKADPTRTLHPQPLPVDIDSRIELLRREVVAEVLPEPVWTDSIRSILESVISERERADELALVGLVPTRSLLFVGRPGVGKTLAARWLSLRLNRPLLTLDLAAVMSSFLGKTGNNLRVVLDYARKTPSVLLLDEFDAIAKRRDDATEIGELKRLVTVLLQAVDDWPGEGLLIAATNHPELLDPAVWRRFDQEVFFPLPSADEAEAAITRLLPEEIQRETIALLAAALLHESFAEIERVVTTSRRRSILNGIPLDAVLLEAASRLCADADRPQRLKIAAALAASGYRQREISDITGLARDTLRRRNIGTRHR